MSDVIGLNETNNLNELNNLKPTIQTSNHPNIRPIRKENAPLIFKLLATDSKIGL